MEVLRRVMELRPDIRVANLLEAGLLKPGDQVYIKQHPNLRATVVDARFVRYKGKQWRYNEWGMHITGWTSINIYESLILTRTGQSLNDFQTSCGGGQPSSAACSISGEAGSTAPPK